MGAKASRQPAKAQPPGQPAAPTYTQLQLWPEGWGPAPEWYFPVLGRQLVERAVLLRRGAGCFLVREAKDGSWVLSVKDAYDSVKHYQVKRSADGCCFISDKRQFADLQALVAHHQASQDGLCVLLGTAITHSFVASVDLSPHELPRATIQLSERLGSGQFGDVYRGIVAAAKTQRPCAVKALKQNVAGMAREEFVLEGIVMAGLQHQHVVGLLGVCTEQSPLLLLLEYLPGGSLLARLQASRVVSEQLRRQWQQQVACGMAYVEARGIVHRDLAARNILLTAHDTAKIADFGMAMHADPTHPMAARSAERAGIMLPVRWSAPEALQFQFSSSSDVWAYAILLVEIYQNGSQPYPDLTNKEVADKVAHGYRHPQPPACPPAVYEVMQQCWASVPTQRPTFSTLQAQLAALP